MYVFDVLGDIRTLTMLNQLIYFLGVFSVWLQWSLMLADEICCWPGGSWEELLCLLLTLSQTSLSWRITASWSRCHNTNPPWSPQCQWWYNSQTLEQRASHLEGKLGQSSGWWWGFRWSVAWAGGIPGGGVERTDVWEEQTDALPAHGGSPPKPTQALENFKLG